LRRWKKIPDAAVENSTFLVKIWVEFDGGLCYDIVVSIWAKCALIPAAEAGQTVSPERRFSQNLF